VRFEGVETRDQAEELRDALLEVDRRQTPPAPAGSYYYFELVGCLCSDRGRGELGRIENVLEDGGGLLLEVHQGHRVLLIPFVKTYLRRVDVERRYVEVDLPEGLIETCAS
jgi:16S rRNA processing protein RimM